MQDLNFPNIELRLKKNEGKAEIFDVFRNKFVVCTPEEWVRQNLLNFLVQFRNYPQNLIAVEKQLNINGLIRRYDAVVFNKNIEPILIIECKAPDVEINQETFDQICAYNSNLNLNYLLISNGYQHIYMKKDAKEKFIFLDNIPYYEEII